MRTSPTVSVLAVLAGAASAASLPAQDQFGRAVAVGEAEVLVMKPSAGSGPATVFVFRRDASGAWGIAERLRAPGAEDSGEGYSPSMALERGTLMVAAGDPEARLGARTFGKGRDGRWRAGGEIALGGAAAPGARASGIDLATVMRILQPPRRVVALDGDRALLAVVDGPGDRRGVRALRRGDPSEPWSADGRLDAGDAGANDLFGAGMAVRGDLAIVGAPGREPAGVAVVFARDASGTWRREAQLAADDVAPGGALGAAVAIDGDVALVGAPGTSGSPGAIVVFRRDSERGGWTPAGRLAPPGSAPGDRFGAALAPVGTELWVAAPGAGGGRGALHRFVRDGAGGWSHAEALEAAGAEPGFFLGLSLAARGDLVAAGAPGADGGRGSVAVYARRDGLWHGPTWLSLGDGLETITGAEVPCVDGEAVQFACGDVDLLAFLPLSALGAAAGERVSDIWGWSDPLTGREYALVGRTAGVAFVDVTEATAPRYLGLLPANPSGARDIKVYRDHMFFTGDGAGTHGLIVFDLTRLRAAGDTPATFDADARYEGIASAHNLVLDPESGFAFPVGSSGGGETCGGGLHMIDVRNPLQPAFAGCYTDTEGLIYQGRTHDAQCVVYAGPDRRYRGRQICFVSNETALRIVDVTEKEHPIPIAAATYPGIAYVHQGWLTDDHRYFYLDDELDELVGQADRTRTLVWDVAELDDPVLAGEYFGPDGATDHNLYIKGDRMYQANYQAGFRIVDISDRAAPVEVGYFDTTPYEGNPPGFTGAWTAFPFFESGTVIVSSMNEGLFVLRPRPSSLVP